MAGIFKKSNQFFRNVFIELKKVKWPTRKELFGYTITVLITVAFLTVFFALVDLGVSEILKLITD
ncbi:preprotein translocase subunit SecE [Pullulanibacillus pueri]|uniref:Protein translocase subunit SecE n=1 Tax=Pullulanibacillus pueri TaxID=1437324 RepID=A0A8J2ZXM8_9BACL|nr:preprotein translocase subunit SecE [Pullulanibacillus pueri]MBM7683153.1 preprotein translocase subunit SecE [Pullulanibacillus pueri]GGH85439.1 protein translocase subunit SecE [Pullulanibacillus pueri]